MNHSESAVKWKLEQQGYMVLNRGWPDLLAYKEVDGKIVEAKAVEVKAPTDHVSAHQRKMHDVLSKMGVIVEVTLTNSPENITASRVVTEKWRRSIRRDIT